MPERTVKELLEYFASKAEVEKVVIYGSRAKGNYRTGSDINFAVWVDEKSGKSVYDLRIEAELDELKTPYMFDVTDYNNLNHKGMKANINKDRKVFYLRG